MGKYLCEKHGEQGIVLTCEHVWQDIVTGSSTIDCVITGEDVVGVIAEEPVAFKVAYCNACTKQYGLPLQGGVLPESAREFLDQAKVVCSECFKVLKESLRPCEPV